MVKKIRNIGIITYAIMLVMSIYFFLERTAFVDISFHLFHIISQDDFAIQNFRFVSFFTQSFPLISSKLGLDLETIMKLYSSSFVILNIIIFTVLIWMKRFRYALGLIFLNTLMVSHVFYWIQSEFQQGLPLMVLYFGCLDYYIKGNKVQNKISILPFILGLVLFTLAFAHPLLLFPFTFLTLYFCLYEKDEWKVYAYSFMAFLGFYLIKTVFFKTSYDSNSMDAVKNIFELFPDYFMLQSNYNFIHYLFRDYHFLPVGYIVLMIVYLKDKDYLKLLLVTCFCVGYTFLVNISYPHGADQFYIENLYMPLSIFISFPLVFEVTQKIKTSYLIPILSVFLLLRFVNIYMNHDIYTERVEYLTELIDRTEQEDDQKKIIKYNEDEMKSKLQMWWGSSYETWLISTIKNKKTSSIIIIDNPERVQWMQSESNKFITNWAGYDYSELPEKYFILNDTSRYKIVEE